MVVSCTSSKLPVTQTATFRKPKNAQVQGIQQSTKRSYFYGEKFRYGSHKPSSSKAALDGSAAMGRRNRWRCTGGLWDRSQIAAGRGLGCQWRLTGCFWRAVQAKSSERFGAH